MGKPIVYCEGCGKSLREEEFTHGRAHTVEHRPYCVECMPLPSPAPTGSSTKTRKTSTAHIPKPVVTPPTTRRGPRSSASKAPLWIGAAIGGAAVIAVIALASSGGSKAPPAPPSPAVQPPKPHPPPKKGDPAVAILQTLERFAASDAGPDAILAKCAEARPTLQGTPHMRRLLQIENRARARKEETAFVVPDPGERALKSLRDLAEGDVDFRRREDVLRMSDAAAKNAGDRLPEVMAVRKKYEERFEKAAEASSADLKKKAAELVEQKLYPAALDALDGYPEAFKATRHAAGLAALRASIDKQWSEANAAAGKKAASQWDDWEIKSKKERTAPSLHASYGGRENVYETHPVSPEAPATLERTMTVPDEGVPRLSVGVAPHDKGNWKARVLINGELAKETDVRGKALDWQELIVDLSAHRGMKVNVRLENAATDWSWEYGYWSHARLLVFHPADREGDSFTVGPRRAKLHGKAIFNSNDHIGGWNSAGTYVDWLVVVPKEGAYTVELTYACSPNCGGAYRLSAGGGPLEGKIKPTGGWKTYKKETLGTIEVSGGPVRIRMEAVKVKGGLLNLRTLRFVPR